MYNPPPDLDHNSAQNLLNRLADIAHELQRAPAWKADGLIDEQQRLLAELSKKRT